MIGPGRMLHLRPALSVCALLVSNLSASAEPWREEAYLARIAPRHIRDTVNTTNFILPPGAVSPADLFGAETGAWTPWSIILVGPDGRFIWVEGGLDASPLTDDVESSCFRDAGGDGILELDSSFFHTLGRQAEPQHRVEALRFLIAKREKHGRTTYVKSREAVVQMNGLWAVGTMATYLRPADATEPTQSACEATPADHESLPMDEPEPQSLTRWEWLSRAFSFGRTRVHLNGTPRTVVLPELSIFTPRDYFHDEVAAITWFQQLAGEGVFDTDNVLPPQYRRTRAAGPVSSCHEAYRAALSAAEFRYQAAMSRGLQRLISGSSFWLLMIGLAGCCVGIKVATWLGPPRYLRIYLAAAVAGGLLALTALAGIERGRYQACQETAAQARSAARAQAEKNKEACCLKDPEDCARESE